MGVSLSCPSGYPTSDFVIKAQFKKRGVTKEEEENCITKGNPEVNRILDIIRDSKDLILSILKKNTYNYGNGSYYSEALLNITLEARFKEDEVEVIRDILNIDPNIKLYADIWRVDDKKILKIIIRYNPIQPSIISIISSFFYRV